MKKLNQLFVYFHTIKYLKPIQITHQIKRRILNPQKQSVSRRVKNIKPFKSYQIPNLVIPELDFDKRYLSRFDVEKLMCGQVDLLHECHVLDLNKWEIEEASHLWNYNLHYLEFLIPLAVKYKQTSNKKYLFKWEEIVSAWIKNSAIDSYEPYTISLRIPNLIVCMNILGNGLDDDLKNEVVQSIYHQYRYLLKNQELGLLGNHYFENLKTIVICSLMFGDSIIYDKYYRTFEEQIDEQILADGIHFELSLMYHKIILEDILRVKNAMLNFDKDTSQLDATIYHMTSAMMSLEKKFERTPLFNDAGDNVAKSKEALCNAIGKFNLEHECSHAGYFRLDNNEYSILFDCGQLGPSYMSGHSHCDALSFELSVKGKMLFVNSGTGLYQGDLRSFFRSTRAHNTMMIDNREQSELWGEHRAAKRLSNVKCSTAPNMLAGEFTSYLKDSFKRTLEWVDKTLIIEDSVKSDEKTHTLRVFFHLAPGYLFEKDVKKVLSIKHGKYQQRIATINLDPISKYVIHQTGEICIYAKDFGDFQEKEVLEIQLPFTGNAKMKTIINFLK